MIYPVTLYIGVGQLALGRGNVGNKVCTRCPVVICGREFITNFLLIDNCDFDMILGMDWLSRVPAVINCQKKSVIFQIPNQPEFEFLGECRIVD